MNEKETKTYIEMIDSIYLKKKIELTDKQTRELTKTYSKALREVSEKLTKSKTGSIAERYYTEMSKSLYTELMALNKAGINASANLAVKQHAELMQQLNFDYGTPTSQFSKMFATVPDETLKALMSGGIYSDGAGLSSRVWRHSALASNQVKEIVDAGLAQGKSAKEMAKLLQNHVYHGKAGLLKSKSAIEGLGVAYKKIDANALRLARTSISHSFTLAQKLGAKDHPFQEGFIWHSVFSHGRTCQECMDRDGVYFSTKDLPYDHPNGMCWNEPYYDKPMDYYADRITDWLKTGDDMLLEKWYNKAYLGMTTKEAHTQAKATIQAIKLSKGIKPKGVQGGNLSPRQEEFRRRAREYRRVTCDDVDTWDAGYYEKWKNALSKPQRDAIRDYTGSDYRMMNGHLRGRSITYDRDELASIQNAIKALDRASVPEDIITFRGSSKSILRSTGIDNDIMEGWLMNGSKDLHRLEGLIVSDKGFLSTAVTSDKAFRADLLFEIKVPAGTKGAYVKSMSNFSNENELLLQAGTRMIIEKAEQMAEGKIKFIVEVLP